MATIVDTSDPLSETSNKRTCKDKPPALDLNGMLARSAQFWHKCAPRKVVAVQKDDTDNQAWPLWQKHLNGRTQPALPSELAGKASALLWGVSPAAGQESLTAWLQMLKGVTAAKSQAVGHQPIARWLTDACKQPPSSTHAWECLAVAYQLPVLAKRLPAELWWSLCDCLFSTASEAQLQLLGEDIDAESVLTHQLLAGELGLVLASQFPEVEPLRALRKTASLTLSESLPALLDGEGLLRGQHRPAMRTLLACWTRCRLLGQNWKKGCWSKEAETQYEWMIRHAIRCSRPDGSMAFSQPEEIEWSPALFSTALDLVGDDEDNVAANSLLPKGALPKNAFLKNVSLKHADIDEEDIPEPENHSEWAGLAVLASDWLKTSPRISIAYDGQHFPLVEVAAGRELLFSGQWQFQLTCDGKTVTYDHDWEEQCWQSDEECDFLELSVDLSHGLKLERQLLLAHDDEVLYLADYVVSEDGVAREIAYRGELPLAQGVKVQAERETRDVLLTRGGKARATVLPLALPEWRTDSRIGELSVDDRRLIISHNVVGANFCCPLFFDLKPRRVPKQRTWRQLTVAEQLKAQPHDVAAGFRVQSGKDQWLFYRSLAEPANRTLLGHNLSSEFFAGRFLETGEAEEMIEIDAGDE